MQLSPRDPYNEELLSHAHPADWRNPTPTGNYSLVAIGGGTAGLVAAAGAAGFCAGWLVVGAGICCCGIGDG